MVAGFLPKRSQSNDAIRLTKRERLQDNRVYHAEDGRACADSYANTLSGPTYGLVQTKHQASRASTERSAGG
jgi:hypothetical protein